MTGTPRLGEDASPWKRAVLDSPHEEKLVSPPADPLLAAIPLDVRDDWRKNPTPGKIGTLTI